MAPRARTRTAAAMAIAVLGAAGLLTGSATSSSAHGTAEGPQVQLLARSSFPDKIAAQFRIKADRGGTQVVNVRDASDTAVARLDFAPGAAVGWHSHPGPAIVSVVEGALTVVNASDCVVRVYAAGQAFVDPGQGNVHNAYNAGAVRTTVYATFLGVPGGTPPTVPAADPGCDL
jgi:quercetin dioxygenase-like cupin family protein